MRHTFNNTIHAIGRICLLAGFIFAVKAAGMADNGSDLEPIIKLSLCGVSCVGCGTYLNWYKI